MEITVVSWNIAGAHLPRSNIPFDYEPENIGYFADELQKIDPDIVCFQETHINESRSVAGEIGKKIGLNLIADTDYSPSHIDPEYRLGGAVISKIDPIQKEEYLFPYPTFPMHFPDGRPAAHHDKGFQVIEFSFGKVINLQMLPIRFFGTPYDSEEGRDFAKQMESELEKHASTPLIICGDFNYKEAETLYQNILNKFNLKNVLPEGPTRPDGKKSDYIFASSEFSPIETGIVKARADHYPCWAKLKLS